MRILRGPRYANVGVAGVPAAGDAIKANQVSSDDRLPVPVQVAKWSSSRLEGGKYLQEVQADGFEGFGVDDSADGSSSGCSP